MHYLSKFVVAAVVEMLMSFFFCLFFNCTVVVLMQLLFASAREAFKYPSFRQVVAASDPSELLPNLRGKRESPCSFTNSFVAESSPYVIYFYHVRCIHDTEVRCTMGGRVEITGGIFNNCFSGEEEEEEEGEEGGV